MSVTIERQETIITEYKTFDISKLGSELNKEMETEFNALNSKNQEANRDFNSQIDGYERLGKEHIALQKESNAEHEKRKAILGALNDANNQHNTYANKANLENAGLRTQVADKDQPLRVLQNEVTNLHLDNKNLQLVIDTEAALREAKANAEKEACTFVNTDLKDHTTKLQNILNDETQKRDEAKRILDDLTKRHKDAKAALEALLKEAEADKAKVEKEITDLRSNLVQKRSEGEDLRTKSISAEKKVAQLRESINQLVLDLNALKAKNEEEANRLEADRVRNEKLIEALTEDLTSNNHEHEKLKILIEKAQHEIVFLGSEKDKHQSQHYQKRIDDFLKNTADSETKSKNLNDELKRLVAEWNDRLQAVTRDTENTIKSNEYQDHVKRVERLVYAQDLKLREIEDLKRRREELQKAISTEPSDSKDSKIYSLRSDLDKINSQLLDALSSKNNLYDQLVSNTRDLLNIDEQIQLNSQEIARLTNDLGILTKQLEQRELILRHKLEEIEEIKRLREIEKQRLLQLIRDREERIKELERILLEMRTRPKTPEPVPVVEEKVEPPKIEITDDVDAMLAQYIQGCPVPIKRLGGGYYMFGTKKIYAKILNGKLVIRVGGGYMDITEFIKAYADAELLKVNRRREQGLDIFTGKPLSESLNKSMKSPGGKKSPTKFVSGTDAPTQLTADDIKEYKSK